MKSILLLALLVSTGTVRADLLLARNSKANYVIVIDPAATAPEQTAARELAATLRQITGAEFVIQTNTKAPTRAILVGAGEAARKAFVEGLLTDLVTRSLSSRPKAIACCSPAGALAVRSTP